MPFLLEKEDSQTHKNFSLLPEVVLLWQEEHYLPFKKQVLKTYIYTTSAHSLLF
jgi:hypothetical protein